MSESIPGTDKKVVAGVCGILLGALGIHKFILGYNTEAGILLLVSVLTCGIAAGVVAIDGLLEGILNLTKRDENFVNTYVTHNKGWF